MDTDELHLARDAARSGGVGSGKKSRHLSGGDVLLSEREVIFLFEGTQLDETMQRLVRDPSVWQAASGWSPVIAGRPRLADQRFGWDSGRRIR